MKVVQRPSSEATVSVPWCFLAGRLGREEGLKDPVEDLVAARK